MKIHGVLLLLLIIVTVQASAQQQLLQRSLSDDGKTLHLKVNVDNRDLNIKYDKKYDVSKMNKEQIDQLVQNVLEGLGVAKFFPPSTTNVSTSQHSSSESNDQQQIERAILNYVEGVYEADTAKIYESVAPFLAKRGYYVRNGEVREGIMTFGQLVSLTKTWNQNQKITETTPKKITVFDILDKTASAKVEAQWGIDYFHLGKINGKWTIINVLWQDYPIKN